jgi:hypothetical protein
MSGFGGIVLGLHDYVELGLLAEGREPLRLEQKAPPSDFAASNSPRSPALRPQITFVL